MPLEEPAVVVAVDEGPDHRSGLLEGFEVVQIDALFLERPEEALRDAVALRFTHVGGRGADAEPLDLGLELPGPVLRTPVGPQTEAQGDCLAEAAHVGPHPLADRLQRRPAVALLCDVPADDLRRAVVDGREEPTQALRLRPEPRRVRAPEFVRALGPGLGRCGSGLRGDAPAAPAPATRASASASAPGSCRPASPWPQAAPRLHLPVALAEERTRLQHRPDLLKELLVAQCRLRARFLGCR